MDEPFVINLDTAPAFSHPRHATHIELEPKGARWPDLGLNVAVMLPGQPNCRYHSEPVQEDFLVLAGECDVVLGTQLRRLHQWDFFHCPAGTEHVFVGAGEGPCAVLMIGSRREDAAFYPYNELAARFGASARADTDDPAAAYADWRQQPLEPAENPWPLESHEERDDALAASGAGMGGVPQKCDRGGGTAEQMTARFARHTHQLDACVKFWRDDLGLPEIGRFEDHEGYDGVILDLPGTAAHLEFTAGGEEHAPPPHPETLLVLYLGSWEAVRERALRLSGEPVEASNPYWRRHGLTFEDPDGFRVVLAATRWSA